MSSLWTPGGEHEVPRQAQPGAESHDEGPVLEVDEETMAALEAMSPEERAQAEQMIAQMATARAEIASTPASTIISNHAMGMFELGAIHLSQQPPNLAEASLAIEGLAGVLTTLEGRLGENEATLRQALSQLQMAFLELTKQAPLDSGGASAE